MLDRRYYVAPRRSIKTRRGLVHGGNAVYQNDFPAGHLDKLLERGAVHAEIYVDASQIERKPASDKPEEPNQGQQAGKAVKVEYKESGEEDSEQDSKPASKQRKKPARRKTSKTRAKKEQTSQ